MPYVERAFGSICGVYANFQAGYAEEELLGGDAELLAFSEGFASSQSTITASIYATGKFIINGAEISSVNVSSRFSGAFKVDVGSFWVFFTDEQPDTNYIAQAFDGGLFRCYVKPEDYGTDSVIITTTDLAGAPADPAIFSLIITRAS